MENSNSENDCIEINTNIKNNKNVKNVKNDKNNKNNKLSFNIKAIHELIEKIENRVKNIDLQL